MHRWTSGRSSYLDFPERRFCVIRLMTDSNHVIRKKRGRPRTGQIPVVTFRLEPEWRQEIEIGINTLPNSACPVAWAGLGIRRFTIRFGKRIGGRGTNGAGVDL